MLYSYYYFIICLFFFKQKTAYEMRISDWSSDVCSSDLVLQHHGKGIRLLPARAGGAPDADLLAAGARLQQVRQHDILELLERPVIAENERLVGGHRVGDVDRQALVLLRPQGGNQRIDAVEVPLARHRVQAALQKIGFLLGDHEAGALVQQLRDVFEVIHIHAADLITNLRTLGPISRSGRTADRKSTRLNSSH